MPLTKLQSHVLRLLAAQRSPDSYIAGGIALNREGPRFSGDIDIFQNSEDRLETAAEADAVAIKESDGWRRQLVAGVRSTRGLTVADNALGFQRFTA